MIGSLRQSFRYAHRKLRRGERGPRRLAALMQDHIRRMAGATLEYAVVVDSLTLVELDAPQAEMVALVAARVGTTRLIDNAVWRTEK